MKSMDKAARLAMMPEYEMYCVEPVDIECAYVAFCYEIKLETSGLK